MCPNLKYLLINNNHPERFSSTAFLRFLQSMSQLQALELFHGHGLTINATVLIQIANMPFLRHLSLGDVGTLTMYVLDHSHVKLSRLQSLALRNFEGPAVRALLPLMSELRDLDLYMRADVNMSKDVLTPLQHCHQLESMVLHGPGSLSFTPTALETMTRGTKRLRAMALEVESDG